MNDFPQERRFTFGKVELGVVNEPSLAAIQDTVGLVNPHAQTVSDALRRKDTAVQTLDDLRFSPSRKFTIADYHTIRDALESMASLLEPEYRRPAGVTRRESVSPGTQARSKGKNRYSKKKRRNRPCNIP